MERTLNIVSFAVPLPADYGGAIEVFYKLKALSAAGVKVIFHCFQYANQQQSEILDEWCEEVYYYERNKSIRSLLSRNPYIVESRRNPALLERLQKNDHPILFEGVHTSAYINHPSLVKRKKIVRMANIESNYYQGLFKASSNIVKGLYYWLEARKLKRYENNLQPADRLIAISKFEYQILAILYGNQVAYIPPFHPFDTVIESLKEDFLLYHGNLKVEENNEAAMYLVDNIFSQLTYKTVIAGKSPSRQLKALIAKYDHITLIESPEDEQLQQLIKSAKINVLYTSQRTGLKLKLLNVLYNGGLLIVNDLMAEGTQLEEVICVAKEDDEMIFKIHKMMLGDLNYDLEQRKAQLESNYNNLKNAEALCELIFS